MQKLLIDEEGIHEKERLFFVCGDVSDGCFTGAGSVIAVLLLSSPGVNTVPTAKASKPIICNGLSIELPLIKMNY